MPLFVRNWLLESLTIFWKVAKILVPIVVIFKGLEFLQLEHLIADWLAPTMQLLGLPGYAGIIWASAMIGNIYSGLAILAMYWQDQPLSVAQVSTLSLIILIAHSLVVEAIISKKAGTTFLFAIVWRITNAYFIGWIVHQFCSYFNLLQETASIIFISSQTDNSLTSWLVAQLQTLAIMFIIISLLIAMINALKYYRIEKYFHQLISPFLKMFFLPNKAANITIIGMLLGISYGAGLLIRDIESGQVSRQDGAVVMGILNLNHAVIEDTALMLLVGSTLWIVLVARLMIGLPLSWLYSYLLKTIPLARKITVS